MAVWNGAGVDHKPATPVDEIVTVPARIKAITAELLVISSGIFQ